MQVLVVVIDLVVDLVFHEGRRILSPPVRPRIETHLDDMVVLVRHSDLHRVGPVGITESGVVVVDHEVGGPVVDMVSGRALGGGIAVHSRQGIDVAVDQTVPPSGSTVRRRLSRLCDRRKPNSAQCHKSYWY